MKKAIGIILVLATVIACCFAFTACNKDTTGLEDGALNVATNCEFDPFEYLDESGNPTGIDMDIAQAIAKELGVTCKITDMAFDSVVGSVASGAQDVAMAGLTVTNERKQSVDFTQTYFSSSQVVIAKNGSTILDIVAASDSDEDLATAIAAIEKELAGKKIGVQNGTTGYAYVSGDSDDYDGIGATATGFASGALAVQALLNGTVDYVVIDAVPASKLVAANAGIKASSVVLTGEDYAFAVKKGNTELLNKINKAMDKLIADGTIESIFSKYGLSSGLGE
ncbi:MAG: transporter substrate-binding domain-containing protein [Christensenellales bacterium]